LQPGLFKIKRAVGCIRVFGLKLPKALKNYIFLFRLVGASKFLPPPAPETKTHFSPAYNN